MNGTDLTQTRRRWLGVLAAAPAGALADAWAREADAPSMRFLRAPETGLVMVRGRMGGTGRRFNMGEMTVTRCAVVAGETVGHGYVAGRDKRRAEMVARLDALLQMDGRRERLLRELVEPLAAAQADARATTARKAAATKVDFFTLVRGEG
ncbi:phosphonate C-P lyase system protein PhnG [Marinimicrococcus flavescens]|uniref:Phosphonate C-P lyase system protein PhnG n=1 Tax=Marinimicrococcus flavescens TaxID=3031815 RepID=A0AAP3UY98_9PROT|nr:phosphonate C-P lyase system protein PhnG [Marinimicrococcus flavescens]